MKKKNTGSFPNDIYAKVTEITTDFLVVDYCGKIYRIDFDQYPYFRYCSPDELNNIHASASGLHWPDADIDLEVEYINNPPSNVSNSDVNKWLAWRKKKHSLLS